MAISRMQQPRQMYGLGSFVKKDFRGVKKIAKSPLGKAAMIGALGFGIPGTSIGGLFGRAGFGGAATGMLGSQGIGATMAKSLPSLFANPKGMAARHLDQGFFPKMLGKMTTGQKIFAGLGATAIASPFLAKAFGKGPEEMVEEVDEDYIPPYMAYQMSRNKDPYMNFLPPEASAQSSYYTPQLAANGGRIGYAGGMIVEDEEDINLNRPFNMGNMMSRRGYANGNRARIGFKGGGADMGDPARAQERADRGYGNTSGPDDRSTMAQTINHINAMENAKYDNHVYPAGTEGYVEYQNELSRDDFYDDAFETDKRNKLMQARINKENEEQVSVMDFENYPSRESLLEDKLNQNYEAPIEKVFDNFEGPGYLTEEQIQELDLRLHGDEDKDTKGVFGSIPMNSVTGYPEMSSAAFTNVLKGIDDPYSLDRNQIQKYYANGGRTGYANGEMVEKSMTEEVRLPDEAEQMLQVEYKKYIEGGGQLPYPEFKKLVLQQMQQERSAPDETMMAETETVEAAPTAMMAGGGLTSVPGYGTPAGTNKFGYPSGGARVGAEEGGLMNLGGMEKDYRAEGGFVPIGAKEKADDVPARLSVNEFVFTADAVRNAGGGDIDKGAEVMENMMNHLENGGQVSEESQGGEGAQAMYDQQQMLQSRMG
jgi:hypothetical protein